MWNDTEIPLAFLITVRCRGTWLHGDERGSIDRFNNVYGSPRIPPNERWHDYNLTNLNGDPVYLGGTRRRVVEEAVRETCLFRNWKLLAQNIRTNHFHAVVAAGAAKPSSVLHALKANATRLLRQNGCWEFPYSPWVDKGSNRFLWNEQSIDNAIDYVVNGQGDKLPDFL